MYILGGTAQTNNQPMNQYSGTRKKSPRRLHAEDGKFTPDYTGETKRLRSMRLTDMPLLLSCLPKIPLHATSMGA
jgi:hypothetical protein